MAVTQSQDMESDRVIRLRDALHESRRRYDTLVANLPGMAYQCRNDNHRTLTFVSEGCRDLLGREPESLLENRGVAFMELIHPEDRGRVRFLIQDAVRRGRSFQLDYRILKSPDDTPVWVWEKGIAVEEGPDGPRLLEGFVTDFTRPDSPEAERQRERLEVQLRQSQKMEAIGRLAGGVAHDFNNHVAVILGFSDLVLADMDREDALYPLVQQIWHAGDRAKDVAQQLLAFSRRQVVEMKYLDLNQVIGDMEKMLRPLIGENIELSTQLTPNLPTVRADISQIQQVVMNLTINARDAISYTGRLTIETGVVRLDDSYADAHVSVIPGRYVMLSVSDTGVGMNEEVRSQIFEPFFTTKPMGKGTGLGLSTVYGIVKQHDGYVWVYSEPGLGTTFKIYLPCSEGIPGEPSEMDAGREGEKGDETIFVVEDHDMVRNLAAHVLRRYGYHVVDTGDAEEALEMARDFKEPIHLLVSDVIMPKLNGRELYHRLRRFHPETRVLYMSGYTDNVISHHGVLDDGIHFIQKPFSVQVFTAKVRQVLADAEDLPGEATDAEGRREWR